LARVCPQCGAANSLAATRCVSCGESFASDAQVFAQMFQKSSKRPIRGQYVIESTLSRTRVSALYRVRDNKSGDNYLLQEFSEIALLTGEEKRNARRAFQRETARWRELDHPALPTIADVFASREKHYILLALDRGWTLEQLLRSPSLSLGQDRVSNWGAQLCELLAYLHSQDPEIILEEFKPNGIVIVESGLVQLVDYRLADHFNPAQAESAGPSLRSPYQAPELRYGQLSPAADIYSLGMLLYALMSHRVLDRDARRPAASGGEVPGASRRFEAAIIRATKRDPTDRFESAAAFREMIWGDEPIVLQPLRLRRKRAGAATAKQTPSRRQRAKPSRRTAQPAAPKPPKAKPEPAIRIRPRRLEVELGARDQKQTAQLAIYNIGKVELEGRLIPQVDWLVLGRNRFHLKPKQAIRIPVTIRGAKLEQREGVIEPQALLIDANSGRHWVTAQVTISLVPELVLPQDVLDFGQVQGNKDLSSQLPITNSGGGTLTGNVQSRVPWLEISNSRFHCSSQETTQVPVTVKLDQLSPGIHQEDAALIIDSDAGQGRVGVRIHHVRPRLAFSPETLDLGQVLVDSQAKGTLTVTNRGKGHLDFRLRSRVPWLHVPEKAARCLAGQGAKVPVVVDATNLDKGRQDTSEALVIQSNVGVFPVPLTFRVLAPQLQIVQSALDFGELTAEATGQLTLTIRNAGTAPLEASLTTAVDWLRPAEEEVTVPPQTDHQIEVKAHVQGIDRGQEIRIEDALRVESNGGNETLPLHLFLLKPALEVSPSRLDFGVIDRMTPMEKQLVLRNPDTGVLKWEIETDALWLEVVPQQGICHAGNERVIHLTAYGLALPEEEDRATDVIRITSNGGQQEVPISINVASPVLDVDVMQVDLGTSINHAEAVGSFMIFNHGLGPLQGTIEIQSERLSVKPRTVRCETGMTQVIQVRANTDEMAAGLVYDPDSILITTNGGEMSLNVTYEIVLEPELEAELIPLTIDPEGAQAQGRLILRNVGGETARATITPNSPRLQVSRRTCAIKPEKTLRLQVSLDLEASDAFEDFCLEVESPEQTLEIPVSLDETVPNA
jgi:serine/threonine-protein kinase